MAPPKDMYDLSIATSLGWEPQVTYCWRCPPEAPPPLSLSSQVEAEVPLAPTPATGIEKLPGEARAHPDPRFSYCQNYTAVLLHGWMAGPTSLVSTNLLHLVSPSSIQLLVLPSGIWCVRLAVAGRVSIELIIHLCSLKPINSKI